MAWPIVAGVVVGMVLTLAWVMYAASSRAGPLWPAYTSNGQRIFLTATSGRGTPITMSMGGMPMGGMMASAGMMACADCHGPDGRGGQVNMMMGSFEAPDIRYKALVQHASEPTRTNAAEPAYDDASLRRAITRGVDPAGQPLKFPMPRWQMSDADLSDAIEYLKALP